MSEYALRFTIELLEDTHTGTGMGRLGLVDDTQSRDQHGRPVIWASTLRGLLREAGEDWLLNLEQAGTAQAQLASRRELLYRLFGPPMNKTVQGQRRGRGVCQIRSLRIDDRNQRRNGGSATPEMFNQWTSTAREVHSRRPMEHTLRTVETAAAGLQLRGEIRWRCSADEAEQIAQSVQGCLQRITAVGSGKTRGLGRIRLCDVSCIEITEGTHADPQAEWLRPLQQMPAETPVLLDVALRNLEPLLLVTTTYASNLNDSLDHLPGGTLRGAILHWIAERDSTLSERLADPLQFRVTNAYVLDPEPLRDDQPLASAVAASLGDWQTLPAPLSLRAFKAGVGPSVHPPAEQKPLPWWARADSSGDFLGQRDERDAIAEVDRPDGTGLRKRIKASEYLVRSGDGGAWRRVRPRMGVVLRNRVPTERIDPHDRGRDTQHGFQEDALFSEQVIWDGQVYLCRLWFASREVAEHFGRLAAPLFTGDPATRSWLRVGRGGRPVRVEASQWQAAPSASSSPAADTSQPAAGADYVTVTLTSDLIGRTRWLTFATAPTTADWLRWFRRAAQDAGIDLSLPKDDTITIDPDRTILETTDVYG
ncbi:MAG: hypothetical protein D6725_01415, partial [Planctomycetota bacterium]